MPQFLYQLHALKPEIIENPELMTEDDIALGYAHVAHIQQGVADDIVILAGRCQDNIGPAIIILETESEEAARAFMNADPFVTGGFAKATLHPYRVAFSRREV